MSLNQFKDKKIFFVTGKGGVGKTLVSQSLAHALSKQNKKTLLVEMLPPLATEQNLSQLSKTLWHLPLIAKTCFQEYIHLKLKLRALSSLFLDNRLTQYLEKAAPGLKELVLIGKVWFERENYDSIVVDMPSTGYAAAMVNTPMNFANLFPGGPIHKDCESMVQTFSDPETTAFLFVTLLEEMPIQETIEFSKKWSDLFPKNQPQVLINRKMILSPQEKELYLRRIKIFENKNKLENPFVRGFYFLNQLEQNQLQYQNSLQVALSDNAKLLLSPIPEWMKSDTPFSSFKKTVTQFMDQWFEENLQ